MSAGLSRGWRKGLRTVAQLVAGGALTALVTAIVGGMPPATQGLVMGAWVTVVAFAQNWAETAGAIPTLLPTAEVVVGPTSDAVATVDAAADETGEIAGDVLDISGDVVGEVTGQLAPDKDGDQGGGAGLVALLVAVFLALLAVGGFAVFSLLAADESVESDLLGRLTLV